MINRSQWPRGLRRGSAAPRFPGLWVRIPSCVCQVEVSASSWSLIQRSVVCLSVIVKPRKRRPCLVMGSMHHKKEISTVNMKRVWTWFEDRPACCSYSLFQFGYTVNFFFLRLRTCPEASDISCSERTTPQRITTEYEGAIKKTFLHVEGCVHI